MFCSAEKVYCINKIKSSFEYCFLYRFLDLVVQ